MGTCCSAGIRSIGGWVNASTTLFNRCVPSKKRSAGLLAYSGQRLPYMMVVMIEAEVRRICVNKSCMRRL